MEQSELSKLDAAVEDMARGDQLAFNNHVAGKLRVLESGQKDIETKLKENTDITNEVREIVLLFRGLGEWLRKWSNRIRRWAIWITPIGALAYGAWHWLNEYRKSKGS